MADNLEPEAQAPADDDPKAPNWYREQMARKDAENKALKDTVTSLAFTNAGIDTSKPLGQTMRENYRGEPSVEAIRKYAQEKFEWQPPAAPLPEAHQEVVDATARVDAVTASAQSTGEITLEKQIADAEKAGDWGLSVRLKAQKMQQRLAERT
jgi:hypothetical protein